MSSFNSLPGSQQAFIHHQYLHLNLSLGQWEKEKEELGCGGGVVVKE
jgi:hypothetical protein